jgi:hypothetical protein
MTPLEKHDVEIIMTKTRMNIAKENNNHKAFNDLKKHYDKLIKQKKIYCKLMNT